MMRITDKGLVIKEVKLRESDRILTLLTAGHGVVQVCARGSLKPGGKLFSASGLFCYAEWTMKEGKNLYNAEEAAVIEVFFGLRSSLEALALATYMAEIAALLALAENEAGTILRLVLNCLHLLCRETMPPLAVKALFELRALSETGFMPDILMCDGCGRYEGGPFYLNPRDGSLLCEDCAGKRQQTPNLNPQALAALRHIVLSGEDKLFAFRLVGASLGMLACLAEAYLLFHLEYPPKSMAYLKTVLDADTGRPDISEENG